MAAERLNQVRASIFQASQSLLQTLSTSLGPRGLDKMIVKDKKTVVTNDGATILKYLNQHPIHGILSNMSAAQDEECGDGTTSVVVLAGCLLESVSNLLERNVHPSVICDNLEIAKRIGLKYIDKVKIECDRKDFINNVSTALCSKIASSTGEMAVAAIKGMEYVNGDKSKIRIVKKVGGGLEDARAYKSILLGCDLKDIPKKAKLGVVQFCLSAPKTNMDSKILINDSALMEKLIQEERRYILEMCKKIKKSGCTLLVIQKSILRESLSDLASHFLKQLNILVVNSVDRKDIDYICNSVNVEPVSEIDLLSPGSLVDVEIGEVEGMLEIKGHGCTILLRGCDDTVVEEAERSLNDALCVVKCLEEQPFLVPGGGSIEMGIALMLSECTEGNVYVLREIAKAFEGVPYFLARNAGLYPVEIVSELRKELKQNDCVGISVRSGHAGDMVKEDSVVQPAKVSISVITLAIEAVSMILKIDDILPARR
ncbi:TCP-1 chaperonin subunit delta [Encephalitozoon hellem ATCC 50504]|uniref:T complex subunit beta n=1 Tax=Encephalitozoon hellem TaxID=27973 RepID=A0A9Q9CB05_ENCHE|nr:TCP-1 chaperonin subunit delta [Encephalitozoon hellem ATCC 50504]AFM97802.1 TCP-1 chaperonin subunit delta [Encephalitozoon hellem ATCC 50504]UTX42573.1 T complex subunit beta [Encephalitozoon hellem]WEL38028.1 T complex subunit beta [Encephalitozoon hellem]|eukprot:XP_003886783.1 TCP-1 chaperonin subunit delta [Encephalitozoon hellem ATCC 50504]